MNLTTLRRKFRAVRPVLTERSRRVWAASEAIALGHGGIGLVERATGVSRSTISRGIRELAEGASISPARIRRAGGGRKRIETQDVTLCADLDGLVDPTTSGDPDSPLRWTSKSVRRLATALHALGHTVSYRVVADLLRDAGYSLHASRNTHEGTRHPDRDAQFAYLKAQVRRFQQQHRPAISVDTKKKELVGDFENAGREWRPAGSPAEVRIFDFLIPDPGKAIPHGVYDLARSEGWVSVGITHDTGRCAVHAIRRWWRVMGRAAYPDTRALLISADAGGSNGSRVRLWKWELQQFANRTGLAITVCHFPPGTSKWSEIEHRLFSHIAMNWRDEPLVDVATIVSLIGATTSTAGLRVRSELDDRVYAKGVAITDAQMARMQLVPHAFHGEWNYTLHPTRAKPL